MRSVVIALIATISLTLGNPHPASAQSEKRVALVIGNSAYEKVSKLPNPRRDAEAMGAMLQRAGFDVLVRGDVGGAAMKKALRDFSERVQNADMAVVFYAGHGIEVNGTNYLVPVDAALERDLDVEDETVPLDRVTQMIDSAKRLRLVVLDACRDNPFAQAMKRTTATRSIGRGLARVDVVGSDTLIAFAAKHGSTASDGVGGNSPYTAALVKHLATPGLDLRLALGRVRDEVLMSTGNKQEPFTYGSLGGAELPLVRAAATTVGAPVAITGATTGPAHAPAASEAASEWQRVDKTSVAELETFARRHGTSIEAEYARARLAELRKQPPAVAAIDPRASPLQERDRIAAELSAKQISRSAVAHLDCDTLWYLRNSIFARHNYRFTTPRGQQVFGTGGTVDNPQLSALEERNIDEIQAAERIKGCPSRRRSAMQEPSSRPL
jgi:uncharacterized caspase-like protein